ncbi:MAG: hypothetical protein ACD_49C00025G0001 [uncultured bacterium (gcode 4)]|uniref:SLH domain-containing protein n=1 Tax=uncultured bacterium (gcode 4) TaxID=1234023 RepID=K2AY79_9BACT|nr:MAG: hypothetical protein ACD_49C00025G0001 [uncultured bacterium (gcode 4)]
MSILLKKFTSVVSAAAIAFVAVAPSITNAANGFAPYADALAKAKIITTQSNEAGYRLADSAMRQEVAAMMIALNKADTSAATCTGKFSDVSATKPNSWVCKVVETALSKGLIAANATFRPEANITRAEALAMILKGQGVAIATGATASFNDTPVAWQKDVANTALSKKIISANASFRPNASVTRGELFVMAANAAGLEIASASDDLNLDDLFGDDTATGTTTDTPPADISVKAGDLNVALAASTPAAADLPASAEGVVVAAFDATAGSADITIASVKLTRKGLGAGASVDNVALFANGTRVSKAKSFNSSDDTADVVLSPALVVKAGSTVTLIAKVTTTATAGTFAVELTDVASSAVTVKGTKVIGASFEVKTSPTATAVTIDDDSSVTTPKLGTLQAEILKFKVSANTANHEDVTLSEITLKEDGGIDESSELANVALYYNGTKVADAVSNGSKYFTFKMATPVVVKEGKTEKFVVKADVVGGAGETINFVLDNDLDISATASKYGYVSITDSLAGTALTVQAWEVTLIQIDPTNTEVRQDKDDIVLGTMKVVSKAGKALELEKFKVTIQNTDSSAPANVNTLLENVELFDVVAGTVYDLDLTAAGTTEIYSYDVNITMPASGELTLAIRADTLDTATVNGAKFVASVSYDTTSTSTAGTFAIKETGDDKYVTDVTPSAITFKTVNGTTSSLSINTVAMSATKSAVIGSKGVEGLIFELKSDNDSSDLTVNELKVKGTVVDNASSSTITVAGVDEAVNPAAGNVVITKGDTTTDTIAVDLAATDDTDAEVATAIAAAIDADSDYVATASLGVVTVTWQVESIVTTSLVAAIAAATVTDDVTLTAAYSNNGTTAVASNARVNAMYLYNGTTLLDQVSGSSIGTDGVATFDGFNVKIAKNSSVRFTVTTDILDAAANAYDTLRLNLNGYSVEDEDADDVFSSTPADADGILADWDVQSARIIAITGVGTLTATVDNTDTETDKTKNIIGGATSPFVASYELSATNEGVLVKDFTITETSAQTLAAAVSEIIVYANDKTTELARKTVTSDTITFDNVNFTVEEGSENIYVKVVTSKQGKDQAGAQTADLELKLTVTDAEGASSNKVVSNPAITAASNAFSVLPVKVSSIAFVDSASGVSRATKLNNGSNNVAIIAVTTDSSTNTDSTDSSALKTVLQDIKLDVYNYDGGAVGTAITAMTIEKVNGTNAAIIANLLADDGGAAYTVAGGAVAADAFFNLSGTDYQLDNGTTTYFVVKATVTKDATLGSDTDDYVKVQFDALNASNVIYASDDAVTNNTSVTDLRIGLTKIDGTQINE